MDLASRVAVEQASGHLAPTGVVDAHEQDLGTIVHLRDLCRSILRWRSLPEVRGCGALRFRCLGSILIEDATVPLSLNASLAPPRGSVGWPWASPASSGSCPATPCGPWTGTCPSPATLRGERGVQAQRNGRIFDAPGRPA